MTKEQIVAGLAAYAEETAPVIQDRLTRFLFLTAVAYVSANPKAADVVFQNPLVSSVLGPGPEYNVDAIFAAMQTACETTMGVPVTIPPFLNVPEQTITLGVEDFRKMRDYLRRA